MPHGITTLQTHECPACGAQAEWSPSKQQLLCPFCGTESPYQFDRETGRVVELDLVAALRELPREDAAERAERRPVQCRSCQAVMMFAPDRLGGRCEFCGSPALIPYQEIKSPIRPHGILPFKIDAAKVRDDIRAWWRRQWLAPGGLARQSLVDTVHSIYIPYWTFDARVHCPWQAEAGHHYYVPVTYRTSKGRMATRMERRTRWEPASGAIDHFFDDEPVPGTQGLPVDLLKRIEPFPTPEVVAYDTAFLSGHVVEHYKVVLVEAARQSREQMQAKLHQLCAAEVPGDTYRNLRLFPEYSGQTFKHVLVPVWLLSYDYRGRPYQVVVNGYTGKMAGRRPYSVWKIVLLVLLVLIIAAVVAIVQGQS